MKMSVTAVRLVGTTRRLINEIANAAPSLQLADQRVVGDVSALAQRLVAATNAQDGGTVAHLWAVANSLHRFVDSRVARYYGLP